MKYEIYNGQKINGCDGKEFMKRNPHLTGTVYLFLKDGHVTNVESKNILSDVFKIDKKLPDDKFIAEYEKITSKKEG